VAFLRLALFVFFRRVVVVGGEHIPARGRPVLLVGNHPNSLMDPILLLVAVARASGVHVRFVAKDVLFRSPLGPLLRALGAVPVVRRVDRDGAAGASAEAPASVDNAAAFSAMDEVLRDGGAIGIFLEGLSHDEAQLQRLKTGAARIALATKRAHPDLPIAVVPCGLNYVSRRSFRSQALVQFGAPIEIDAAMIAAHTADERAAVQALTARLDAALRAQTINAPDWDTLRVLDAARRLYQPPRIRLEERIELSRRFAEVYPTVAADPEVRITMRRLHEYVARLEAVGLDDRDLQRRVGRAEAWSRLARHLALALLWLPLAVPGLVVHFPVGMLARLAGHRFAPRRDVTATTKLVVGLALSLMSYGASIAIAARFGSLRLALLVAAVLPISGVAFLVVLDRTHAVSRLLLTMRRLGRLDHELAYLAEERRALEAEVVRLVDRLGPTHLVPLFPRDEAHL
jgi:glycerol-3-phosphate O-acyltransferase/dihydroxyacetone phosphate acyltransferase